MNDIDWSLYHRPSLCKAISSTKTLIAKKLQNVHNQQLLPLLSRIVEPLRLKRNYISAKGQGKWILSSL